MSEIITLSMIHKKSAILFADEVRLKTVRCGNEFPDVRIVKLLVEGFLPSILNVVRII